MNIVDLTQRSEPWRHWRAQGVTASEAAIVMRRSPYKTPWRLWAEKVGWVLESQWFNHPLIRAGIRQEPAALQAFEERHGVMLLPICGESEQYPILRASFDGLSEDNTPVEIKCPHATTFLDVVNKQENASAYQLYWHQVQHQLLVSGSDRGFLSFYHAGQALDFEIRRDDAFLDDLVTQALSFWQDVQLKREPKKDPARDLYLPQEPEIGQWQTLAASYRYNAQQLADLRGQLKALEDQQHPLEEQLVGMMGAYLSAEHSGIRVNRFLSQGTIDYKLALQTLLPQVTEDLLEAYRKPSSLRVRITCREADSHLTQVPFDADTLQQLLGLDVWF